MTLDPHAEHEARDRLAERVRRLASRAASDPFVDLAIERDALLAELARLQAEHVEPFQRLCRARAARFDRGPDAWPALPTDVFRFARVSLFSEGADARVFRTSGTTHGARGAHPQRSLALYDHVAMIAARLALLPEGAFDLLAIASDPSREPDSSLGYMLGLFADEARARAHDAEVRFALGVNARDEGAIDAEAIEAAFARAKERDRPLLLAGTSFGFLFAEDVLRERWIVPDGSWVMFTGGFKGRTRAVDEPTLRALLTRRYGVPDRRVVTEYGMTELSSQLYGRERLEEGEGSRRLLWIPPWLRVTAVDPVTLTPLPEGARGLLRFDDPANVDSVVSIQTADVGALVRTPAGRLALRLEGRDPAAVSRGCSLAIEEALARG